MVTLTNYELSAMSYKGSVAFRPPIARGLAFHKKANFNIIKALYAIHVHQSSQLSDLLRSNPPVINVQ